MIRVDSFRAAEICDLGGDGPPPDYGSEFGSWKPICKNLEVGSRLLEFGSQFRKIWKLEADFWKLEADFLKSWKIGSEKLI